MLPPTSTTAPTSDRAEPTAAMVAAMMPIRASRSASAHLQPAGTEARAWAISPAAAGPRRRSAPR